MQIASTPFNIKHCPPFWQFFIPAGQIDTAATVVEAKVELVVIPVLKEDSSISQNAPKIYI